MFRLKKQLIEECLTALSIDTVQAKPSEGAPFGEGNTKLLLHTLALAESFGFKTKNLDGYCGYADVGEGKPFGILGHLDTVPIGSGWTKNPYGEIVDDVLYGRGAMDDKVPMLSCLFALKSILDDGKKPKRKIRFIFGLNEESGWGCIDHYNKFETMPEEGFSPDADFPVINCELGIVNFKMTAPYSGKCRLTAGERANVVPNCCEVETPYSKKLLSCIQADNIPFKLSADGNVISFKTRGVAAHGARPFEGKNAAIAALSYLDFDEEMKRIYTALKSFYGEGCNLDLADKLSARLTINLGVVRIDNGKIELTVDIRYPVSFSEDEILSRLSKAFSGYSIENVHSHPALYVEKSSPLVQSLLKAYKKATGKNDQPITIGGGTYARALKSGVAFGPQFPNTPTTIHQADERVSIDELMLMTKIYREAFLLTCF